MRFASDVVMFEFAGIPIVGNLQTSAIIGLTEDGAAVCSRMLNDDVSESEVAAVDKDLLNHLKSGGFFDERPDSGKVLSAYLHITQRCNLDCAGCYSLDNDRNILRDAPLSDIKHAIRTLSDAGIAQLVISGGEPFLRADLPDIVKYAAKDCGIKAITVLSNGTCIKDNMLEQLAPHVSSISVSFDGCSATSPAYIRQEQRFNELVKALQAIQRAGISAHIIPTVHARNIADLKDYMALAKKLGATMNFSLLTCEPDDAVLGRLLPKEYELRTLGATLLTLDDGRPIEAMDAPASTNLSVKRNCGAGARSLSIAADGTIYPCHMLHRPELAMGNAFTGSVADALQSSVSHTFKALDASDFDDCASCRHLYLCGGGCRARSLYSTGTLTGKDSYCTMTTTFYDALGSMMNPSKE